MQAFHLQVHGKPPFFQSMHWEHEPSQTKNPRVHHPEKNHSKVLSKQRREDRIYTNLSRMKSTATPLRNEAQTSEVFRQYFFHFFIHRFLPFGLLGVSRVCSCLVPEQPGSGLRHKAGVFATSARRFVAIYKPAYEWLRGGPFSF